MKRILLLFLCVIPSAWIAGQAFMFEDVGFVRQRALGPGAASASHSTVSPATASVVADGASTQVITVQARDASNVNETSGGETVVISKLSGTGSVGSTTDNGNGTYTATLTAPSSSGSASIGATLGGVTVGSAVGASSTAVTYTAAPVSATYSTVTASPTTGVVADGSAYSTITITVKDTGNSPMSGKTVSLSATGGSTSLTSPATTDGSGVTTSHLKSTSSSNTKTVSATVSGVSITQQASVAFVAAAVNGFASTASASPTTGVTADGVATSTITVTLHDANDNPCVGKTVTLSVSGGTGNTHSTPAATDASGVTTGTISSTSTGVKTVTVVGDGVTLNNQPTVTFN